MKKTHPQAELVVLPDVIRVETALSRFPVHRLIKQGTVPIEIRETTADGELVVHWEIAPNARFGQPGPLAYKLDTLVINRKIEAAGRPIPRYIRLGSLKEIAHELDLGGDTTLVKRALLQNAGAFITAKIKYRSHDGREVELDANFTRYEVHFAGERLPDGRKADAVYLVLGETYRRILDTALTRPLDYAYLQDLAPLAQRWYEIVSYRMYAALKHHRPRARLGYAEFCVYAPQMRYPGFGPMRKQMAKLHAPHLRSGYIAGVEFEATTNPDGRPDWALIYTPGPKAQAEFQAFTRKGGPVPRDVELALFEPKPKPKPEPEPGPTGLERELVERGVTRSVAAELVRDFPEDRIRRQVEVVDWLRETKPQRVKDPGAYLAEAIRKDFAPPAGFRSRAEQAEAKATARAEQDQQEQARQAQVRAQAERDQIRAYWEALPAERRAALDAAALAEADPADRTAYETATAPQVKKMLRAGLRDAHLRRLLGLPAVD
ncbi:MAG: hypothetical protein JO075_11075 [Acidimicrobiia bacterium]|nr:hypothetical protein [Acidimicrobiia bacterium]